MPQGLGARETSRPYLVKFGYGITYYQTPISVGSHLRLERFLDDLRLDGIVRLWFSPSFSTLCGDNGWVASRDFTSFAPNGRTLTIRISIGLKVMGRLFLDGSWTTIM
jgi:hypothetical protein